MGDEKQPDLDSWDDFAGDYIKAELVKEWPCVFVCVGVDATTEDGRNKLIATIEYKGRSWKFDLNKTNQKFIRTKISAPKELAGVKITCDKIKVRNPTTQSMVDSLIITSLE